MSMLLASFDYGHFLRAALKIKDLKILNTPFLRYGFGNNGNTSLD